MPDTMFTTLLAAPSWTWTTLHWGAGIVGTILAVGTLVSTTGYAAWWIRVWDFPRLQIAIGTVIAAVLYLVAGAKTGRADYEYLLAAALAASCVWQVFRIWPYTPWAKKQALRAQAVRRGDERALHVVVSNVLQTNRDYARWSAVVLPEQADMIAAAEVDAAWVKHIHQVVGRTHPHTVQCPLDNLYGLAIWSRLPLADAAVEFIVQDDIPSIHGSLILGDGTRVNFHCLHPRPPAPNESSSSGPRDAELVIVGRRVGENRDRHGTPTLVFGDLNDVAWSRTTDLFCKLGRLLDPRKGRGFYNTFSANSRLMRFPLDHIFISPEFRLIDMRVLGHIGSDHFPIAVTLAYEPDQQHAQPAEAASADEQREATERASAASE